MAHAQSRAIEAMPSLGAAQKKLRTHLLLYTSLFLVAWGGLCFYAYATYRDNVAFSRRLQVSQILSSLDLAIVNTVNQRLALLQGLVAHVSSKVALLPSLDADSSAIGKSFTAFSEALNPGKFGVRSLMLAPHNSIRYVFPIDERTAGLVDNDLLSDPRLEFRETVRRIMRTGEAVLHGPQTLHQGSQGLIAIAPIFRADSYWGAVGVAISLETVLEAAHLYQDLNEDLDIAIRNRIETSFFGQTSVFERQPLISTVPVPGGYWQIAIVPKQGWRAVSRDVSLLLLGGMGFFGILIAGLICSKLIQREKLAVTMRKHNLELSEAYRNIHSRALALERANKELEIAGIVFQNSDEAIMVTDAHNRIISVNAAFSRISGYRPAEVLGQDPRMLASGEHDNSFYLKMWSDLRANGFWVGEISNRRKDGTFFPEWLRLMTVRDENRRVTNYIAIFSDITEKKDAEARILRLAYRDPLTGLANRTLLFSRLEQLLSHLRTHNGQTGFLLIDLDNFKMINDTLGHSIGDEVLHAVGERIASRSSAYELVARIGGDEFVVIVTCPAPEAYEEVARSLIPLFTEPIYIGVHEVQITSSVGIALFPRDGNSAQELMRAADAALYSAKDGGRNRIQFFTPDIGNRIAERKVLEDGLRRAIDLRSFSLDYQPQINLATGRLSGFEALVRWRDPKKGFITPASFIPVAEDTGLIIPISDQIIRSAMLLQRKLADNGYGHLLVGINISAVLLRHSDFIERLETITRETACSTHSIELEITESSIMEDAERSLAILRRFKELGFHIAIDDFGTGYSSLSYLRRFTVDCVKIDQSFVRSLPNNSVDHAIVAAIIAMSRNLRFRTVAEGIETALQSTTLHAMGCDIGQGFFFGQPMSEANLLNWLQTRNETTS